MAAYQGRGSLAGFLRIGYIVTLALMAGMITTASVATANSLPSRQPDASASTAAVLAWGNLPGGATTTSGGGDGVGTVPGLIDASAVSAGDSDSFVLETDGTVWAWGDNSEGQLGDGTTISRGAPVHISNLSNISSIDAGSDFTLALDSSGHVWSWGDDSCGQLGNGTTSSSPSPAQISGLTGITAIAAGSGHALALASNGSVWAWGCNSDGAVGDGTTTDALNPVQVSGPTGVTAIEASNASFAVDSAGRLWTWGDNGDGQLGDGSLQDSTTPERIPRINHVAAISADAYHTLARRIDGTVWAWGANDQGELGDGTTRDRRRPERVPGLSNVDWIAAGGQDSFAVESDGTVEGWGYNRKSLDNRGYARVVEPKELPPLDGATTIAAGIGHSVGTEPATRLTIATSGTGSGTVTNDDTNVECANSCAYGFIRSVTISLTETSGAGSIFDGWGGDCAGSLTHRRCTVTTSTDLSVTASFADVKDLTVTKTGTGSGTIESNPAGIECGSSCSAYFPTGATIDLTATPHSSSTFVGWTGACAGQGRTCQVSLTSNASTTAEFDNGLLLTVTKRGTGSGTVTSEPAGINCGSKCSAHFQPGASVTLTATPSTDTTLVRWGGPCASSGTSETCIITLNVSVDVPVTFTALSQESDPAVEFGGWSQHSGSQVSGGTYHSSNVAGDSATFEFAGRAVTWLTRKGPYQGIAIVSIDGVSQGAVDLYAASATAFSRRYSGLAPGSHTITITVSANKNQFSGGYNVILDAYEVKSTVTEDTALALTYDGWIGSTATQASGDTYRLSSDTASASLTFSGTGVEWLTAKGPSYGRADVSIDGIDQGTVDLYAASQVWRVDEGYTGLTDGTHTFVITPLGTKNSASSGTGIVLDAFAPRSD